MNKKFAYYKLEFTDLDVIRETLTPDQGMALICAIADYSRDSTITELPAELKLPFAMLKKKVDQAHEAYEDKCNILRENGRKGGKAKAKNAAKAAELAPDQAKKFKPPTLSQFKNAVKKIVDDNEWESADAYDIESFYDKLCENNWRFEGMAIQSRSDWEEIITAKFHDLPGYDELYIRHYEFVSYLVATYPQLHHRWNDIWDVLDSLFEECWEGDDRTWNVRGSVFKYHEWKAALDALITEWIEEIPP